MYLSGFGNFHQTEAIAGALPKEQNSPQICPFGLYAEQLSGSAFTRPRHVNFRSWLYRIMPSVVHEDYQPYTPQGLIEFHTHQAPNPYRWSSLPEPEKKVDFVDGLFFVAGNKVANTYIYQSSKPMANRYFSNSDGEMLFAPYLGELILFTEFGKLTVSPGQIAVIPRGVKFLVDHADALVCGYLCENLTSPFILPQLGPIGANGLANPRHFLYPVAQFEDKEADVELICKSQDRLWHAKSPHSPLNVVAWQGNYAPYTYDLSLFNTINTVSFDHPDPSIFTVLTAESTIPGVANIDFVIFPPRWIVAEHTFRPPYYHRNMMSEWMGLITGEYDAKKDGFIPGGISIHNGMTAHGPDKDSYLHAISDELNPNKIVDSLAIMFESCEPWQISKKAMDNEARQVDYTQCWQHLPKSFSDKV